MDLKKYKARVRERNKRAAKQLYKKYNSLRIVGGVLKLSHEQIRTLLTEDNPKK